MPQLNAVMEPVSWKMDTWLSNPREMAPSLQQSPFPTWKEPAPLMCGSPCQTFCKSRALSVLAAALGLERACFFSGLVEVQGLSTASHSIAMLSFARKAHVEKFRLNSDGKREQTVSPTTAKQPVTQHLHLRSNGVTPERARFPC
uniref:Uncharacterized protein n=1 Tax=Dromaius novaehollandiae TaxID=8790 RepID=A0A8C4PE14_DRONO